MLNRFFNNNKSLSACDAVLYTQSKYKNLNGNTSIYFDHLYFSYLCSVLVTHVDFENEVIFNSLDGSKKMLIFFTKIISLFTLIIRISLSLLSFKGIHNSALN